LGAIYGRTMQDLAVPLPLAPYTEQSESNLPDGWIDGDIPTCNRAEGGQN
jgi:hypothetical protein